MELIDKSAVTAEIERRILEDYNTEDKEKDAVAQGAIASLKYYIEDTLEVKEVDLEEEMNKWRQKHFEGIGYILDGSGEWLERTSQLDIAKHFFELGLKAQKGE